MKCAREQCDNSISDTRRSDAKYCSDKCYRAAKKIRDQIDYSKKTMLHNIIKNNDYALGIFHRMGQLVPIRFLKRYDFDFGSWIDFEIIRNERVFFMFDYAYTIREVRGNEMIRIWEIDEIIWRKSFI